MMEFNPDGSLKLPGNLLRRKEEDKQRMISQRCIKIRRDVVSTFAPKNCVLHITLSDAIFDSKFIYTLYAYFNQSAQTPNVLRKVDEKNFDVEIGSDFRRCSDCVSLINKYREFLNQNIIEEKGACSYEGRQTNFSYEDHFD